MIIEAVGKYGVLFGLAFVWILFATIQDIRKREVSNWLNFSLIGFALAYRAIYAVFDKKPDFFVFGLIGVVFMVFLANLFYYARAFGGGDVKLLIALGAIIPIESYVGVGYELLGFAFIFLAIGAIYTLAYSPFLIFNKGKRFRSEFKNQWEKGKYISLLAIILAALILGVGKLDISAIIAAAIILVFSLLYYYVKSVDLCMNFLTDASKLTEGDWLEKDVKLSGKIIKKSVHGLSIDEIKKIRKENKKVWIKGGIPFVPVFLINMVFMVFFYLVLELSFEELLFSLF